MKGIIDRDGVKHPVPAGGGGVDPSIPEQLAEKADKVSPELEGHLAMYDEHGNLKDGGAPSQFAAANHTHSAYAAASHGHAKIEDYTGTSGVGGAVEVGEDDVHQGEGIVKITVKGDGAGTDSKSAKINYDNIDNLARALEDPASPSKDGNKLITNGQVYAALPRTIAIYKHNGQYKFDNGYLNNLKYVIQNILAVYDDETVQNVDLSRHIKVDFLDPYDVVFTAWGSLRISISGTGTRTLGIYIYVDGYVFTSSATESSGTITVSTNALSVAENDFISVTSS